MVELIALVFATPFIIVATILLILTLDMMLNYKVTNDELIEILKNVRCWMIPGMNWTDDIGRELKRKVDAVISKAEHKNANEG